MQEISLPRFFREPHVTAPIQQTPSEAMPCGGGVFDPDDGLADKAEPPAPWGVPPGVQNDTGVDTHDDSSKASLCRPSGPHRQNDSGLSTVDPQSGKNAPRPGPARLPRVVVVGPGQAVQIGQTASLDSRVSTGGHKVSDYGDTLKKNKAALMSALAANGASERQKQLLVAVAMQESNLMNKNDGTKSGASQNVSCLNLNLDMLWRLGYRGDGHELNDPAHLSDAVRWALTAMQSWSEDGFLNFLRGGATGFADKKSYGVADYRAAIAAIRGELQRDPALLIDDRRVEIDVGYV